MTAKVDSLTKQLTNKDEKLDIIEKDSGPEGGGRLPATVFQAAEPPNPGYARGNGRHHRTEGAVVDQQDPPLALTDLERAHRIGPAKDKEGRPWKRPTIVRFRSERLRDYVFRSRSNLKEYNQGHPDAMVFMNEDLTANRVSLAFKTRLLKRQQKINDCWTTAGKVVIKALSNEIRQITSYVDLDKYYTLEPRFYPTGTPSATL